MVQYYKQDGNMGNKNSDMVMKNNPIFWQKCPNQGQQRRPDGCLYTQKIKNAHKANILRKMQNIENNEEKCSCSEKMGITEIMGKNLKEKPDAGRKMTERMDVMV